MSTEPAIDAIVGVPEIPVPDTVIPVCIFELISDSITVVLEETAPNTVPWPPRETVLTGM